MLSKVRTDGDPGEPLLADGVIYVGDRAETMYAISIADGAVLWRKAAVGFAFAPAARRGGTIFVASEHGLTALARADGKTLWNCTLDGNATESSPLIVGDRIIVGRLRRRDQGREFRREGDLELLRHGRRGAARRSGPGNGPDCARPRAAASDGSIVYQPVFDQKRIIAIDLKAGRRRWAFETNGWVYGVPALADDKVFFGSQDRQLYCLHKTRKALQWSFPTTSRIEAGVGYQNGSVFCASCDGSVYRVNAETGKEVWTYRTPRSEANPAIYSAPCVYGRRGVFWIIRRVSLLSENRRREIEMENKGCGGCRDHQRAAFRWPPYRGGDQAEFGHEGRERRRDHW